MTVHINRATGVRVRMALAPLVDQWQNENPDRLLPTALVTARATESTGVSPVVVRRHLTDAVADGDLIEILVRRDWLVSLPRGRKFYAVPDGDLYRLSRRRPASRGSNGISFLTTPRGYSVFLDAMTKEFRIGG